MYAYGCIAARFCIMCICVRRQYQEDSPKMRRKIGYILFSSAILLGVGALLGPTILNLNPDISYGSGKDLVFKISEAGSTYKGVTADKYVNDDGTAVDLVGEEFEARLEEWGTEAEVIKEAPDTIRVRVRSQKEEVEYTYLQNYLSFSGGSLSVGASLDTHEDYDYKDSFTTMFDDQTARLEYVTVTNGEVPAVVIPVNETGDTGDFGNLIKFCQNNNHSADSDKEEEESICYLTVWSHKQEGDTYAKATATGDEGDANMARRLIFAEDANYAWYDTDDEDKKYTEFQLIPSSSALTENGFDPSKASEAYMAANYFKLLFNASSYEDIGEGYDITYAFSTDVEATAEKLINIGDWAMHPAFNTTLIASLVVMAFLIALLVAYYRMGSLAILSSMGFTLMAELLLYSAFGAQFGIGTLFGLLVSMLVSAFGGMYYFSKFKEQLYQGRSTKKAHQEAAKRSLFPTLDLSIVGIIIGVCVYGFVPSVAGKAGLMLVLGSFFSAVYNLIVLRLHAALLANSNSVAAKPSSIYNVDPANIPNLANEEKPSYFGAFSSKDTTKAFKPTAIVAGVLALASMVGLIVFSSTSSIFNYSTQYDNNTVSVVEYRAPQNSLLIVSNETQFQAQILDSITLNGEKLPTDSIKLEESTIYLSDEEETIDVDYYTINWTNYYPDDENYEFVVAISGTSNTYSNLRDALTAAVDGVLPSEDTHVTVSNTVGIGGTPSVGAVWLGIGVGLAITAVYLSFRYKFSRGFTLTVLAAGAALLTSGFYALTRITVPAISALAPMGVAVFAVAIGLFILSKEKELYRDSREKDKDNIEFRSMCLKSATSQSLEQIIMLAFLGIGAPLIYLGLSVESWAYLHLATLVGIVFATVMVIALLSSTSIYLSKGLKALRLSLKPIKKETNKDQGSNKKKGSEPEEATFIGIND